MQSPQNNHTTPPSLLIVDDTPENLTVLGQLLRKHYRVRVALSGQRALEICHSPNRPDLILLDVMMPEINGYQVLEQLRADPHTSSIPVIFVTAMDGDEDEELGLQLGAVDYITKPVRPAIVMARVASQLELKRVRDQLSDQNSYLEAELQRRMYHTQRVQDISIQALASLAETRDNETGNHIRRTQGYMELLARHLQYHPRFSHSLSDKMITLMVKSAPLHDIGKVGIPDRILLKPDRLEPEEFEIMKHHCRIGSDAIETAMRGESVEQSPTSLSMEESPFGFLLVAKQIALWHHERWDGSGYPDGLMGDEIPVPARLMALADVYDALVSPRIYKKAFPLEISAQIIQQGRGSHFDPDIVQAFMDNRSGFEALVASLSDDEPA